MTSLALIERLQRRADRDKLGKAGREELHFQRNMQRARKEQGVVHEMPGYSTGPGRVRPPSPTSGFYGSRPSGPAGRVLPQEFRPPGHAQYAALAGFSGFGAEPKGTQIKKKSTAQVRKIVKQLSTKQHLTQKQAKRLERAGTVLLNRAENKRQAEIKVQKARDAVDLRKAQDDADARARAQDIAALQQQSAQVNASDTAGVTTPTGTLPTSTGGGGGGGSVDDSYLYGDTDEFSGGSSLAPTSSGSASPLSPSATTDAAGATSSGPSKGLLIVGAVVLGLFLLSRKRGRR